MEELFGTAIFIIVVVGILCGLGVIDIDALISDPNEVTPAVAPIDIETSAVTPPETKTIVPVAKVRDTPKEPTLATGSVLIELDELEDISETNGFIELKDPKETEGSLFIDLEAR